MPSPIAGSRTAEQAWEQAAACAEQAARALSAERRAMFLRLRDSWIEVAMQKPLAPLAGVASPHLQPAGAVVSALGSDAVRGLTRAEAERRLAEHGLNRLKSAPETPWWRRLAEQFQNVLVLILLAATVISMAEWLLQDPRETVLPYEAIVILAIVVLNALLGFFQEARAERSVRALMALAAPESTVVRDGERRRIPAEAIVLGDIVLLEAGDRVPARSSASTRPGIRCSGSPRPGPPRMIER